MLPKEAILEYQAIYQQLYGITLTIEEATEYATKLFSFIELATEIRRDK